jgi:hypothetical protein
VAPNLLLDAVGAAIFLCVIAFVARTALTPDGVAYFENAELFAHGQWREAIQGYWSPGYSLMLVPVVWMAGDDRALFVTVAHVVQALLGVAALGLAMRAVRARVPAAAQRAVFWGCAWIILRWLTQELLTPDLLLCVLLLLFVVRLPARSMRDQFVLGALAGAGFLVKTSIWPWLVVAAAVAALRCVRTRDWRAFPTATVGLGALIAGAFVLALSVRAGHPTLGSVGPLNVRWYLGDLERRTPDTDRGPHATKGTLRLPTGATVPFHDLRRSTRTYQPWSDPERWSAGVPADAVPAINGRLAALTWVLNLQLVARWALPVAAGLALLVFLVKREASKPSRGSWLLDRPILIVGILNVVVFLVVHVESRLLAPAMLQCLIGAWAVVPGGESTARIPWATRAVMAGVAIQLATYFVPLPGMLAANAAFEGGRHRYLDEQLARNPRHGAIIIGPAISWMTTLWRHHMYVALQIGGEGSERVHALSDTQRLQWLHDLFGPEVLGVGDAVVTLRDGVLRTEAVFIAW